MTTRFLQYLDLQRLAGVNNVLGIDLTDERARIVELRKRGNVFNRFKTHLEPIKSFSIEFKLGMSSDEKAATIKESLREHSVKIKYAITSLQSHGVKIVIASIPAKSKDLNEWIKDNSERLLCLPIPANQLRFQYEILETTESEFTVEITFARNTELELLERFFESLGLHLFCIGVSDRDALNALFIGNSDSFRKDTVFVHCGKTSTSLKLIQGGKVKVSKNILLEDHKESSFEDSLNGQLKTNPSFVFAGDVPESWKNEDLTLLKPLGLATQYTLAIGLAIKGFVPELSPMDFVGPKAIEKHEVNVYKSLFQRTTIVLGALLMFLLLIPMLMDFIIQSRMESVDQKMISSSAAYAEVAALEKSVRELSAQSRSTGGSFLRTDVDGVLRDIAKATPQQVWLYSLAFNPNQNGGHQMVLKGYTKSGEKATDYLKALSSFCSDVRLVRLGSPLESENLLPEGKNAREFSTFEIKAISKR